MDNDKVQEKNSEKAVDNSWEIPWEEMNLFQRLSVYSGWRTDVHIDAIGRDGFEAVMPCGSDKTNVELISKEIVRETDLINQRITWALQVNAFLILSTAIFGTKAAEYGSLFFKYIVPTIGSVVSLSAIVGVSSARVQLSYLLGHWIKINDSYKEKKQFLIRPFGNRAMARLGFWPVYAPMYSLVFGWVFYMLFSGLISRNSSAEISRIISTSEPNSIWYVAGDGDELGVCTYVDDGNPKIECTASRIK